MNNTKITFFPDGRIEGFADTTSPLNRFVTAPNALKWSAMPILTDNFNKEFIVGEVTSLEYRDGDLWCEAKLATGQIVMPEYDYVFGIGCILNEFNMLDDGECLILSADLLEIAITRLDRGVLPL